MTLGREAQGSDRFMKGAELKGVMAGAGYFAAFQAEAWNRLPGVKIAAVADTDKARARTFVSPRCWPETACRTASPT
jgi:predicted dehydrogenase